MSSLTRTARRCAQPAPVASGRRRSDRGAPEVFDFEIRPREIEGNPTDSVPTRVTLLRPDPSNPSEDQLFVDYLPLPRDGWRYDARDRVLSWRGLHGGGLLHVSHDGLSATGNVGAGHDPCGVLGSARAQFLCGVAQNVGASYISSGGIVTGLKWDPSSAEWQNADWVPNRLMLTYTVTSGGPLEPPTFTFEFEDEQTGDIPWQPTLGSFAASLQLGQQGGQMVWNLSFKSQIDPPEDQGTYTGPNSVYPYWLEAVEDAAASTINGVLEINAVAPQGELVGMRGVRNLPGATGYYQVSREHAPFGVFDSRMTIDGRRVPRTSLRGRVLSWQDLPGELQERTGLPARGQLRFNEDGSSAISRDEELIVRRLGATATRIALERHRDLHPRVHESLVGAHEMASASQLDIYGLLAMNPYVQNSEGAWGDAVQAAVTNDLSQIMNSLIPSGLWDLLFSGLPQPTLTGELAIVANSPVPGVNDPKAWYQSLATAVLTDGLSGGSNENCKYLNGPRAQEWLKTQVSTSKVYYTHGQLLFQYRWSEKFPLTPAYLNDQITNAAQYGTVIADQVTKQVNDIKVNVAVDSDSDPHMKEKLIADVQAAGQYATDNKLYWAFAFYTYNTAPAILANIALQIAINTGSSDGTTLSRLFQQNAAVLTALDSSGFFARQYTLTINTFLTTNILPSMFGFLGDASSFDVIKEYLQTWVANNLKNEDADIAKAAADIGAILQDQESDKILHDSIEALRSISGAIQDALALPYVANKWLKWFNTAYPRFSKVGEIFGSLLIGGVTGLGVFNLFTEFKSWDKLTAAEKAQLIVDTVQLGLQIVAAVVKRGIRIYAIYGVEGLTKTQRTAAVFNILASGEAKQLDQGLVKIGNTTARWLADTEGTVGKIAVTNEGVVTAVLVNSAESSAKEAGWAAKIFGKNLDEFIATRIGPLFILAGIGFSIYQIASGEGGIALASDILNIVSGGLMLFATIGGWLVEGGVIAAEGLMAGIITVAGPLAIILALAGVGLMIYEMFQKPPDPVKEFVDNYARPAGLTVRNTSSSIDYAIPYANPDRSDLLMIGFTLSSGGFSLSCGDGGVITRIPTPTALPDSVWQGLTDGLGMSQFVTLAVLEQDSSPVAVLLSLMSDNTISFQPQVKPSPAPTVGAGDGPKVVTQYWLTTPQADATLTSTQNFLASIPLVIQPVLPDQNGNFQPSNASGYLNVTSSGVAYNLSQGVTFTLRMSGMAPNYMRMVDMKFLLNSTPSVMQSYSPSFGVYPSTPATYVVTNDLPSFLTFASNIGTFTPNGQLAATPFDSPNSISMTNAVGTASASFHVTVSTPPPPPTPSAGSFVAVLTPA